MKDLFPEIIKVDDLNEANRLIKSNIEGFFNFFDNSPVCMSITTTSRVYVNINKKFLEKFGYTQKEIIGNTSIQVGILTVEESLKVGAIFKKKGKLQNDIVICIAKDGTEVHTVSSIEIIEINGENFMLASFLDISTIIAQQKIIEKQNKEIIDSINYARLIQNTILPNQKQITEILPDSFVLAKPKNIVSGDFYWIKKIGDKIFVSVCDCTGHGVPGALISIIGSKLLNKFIVEYQFSKPSDILNQLNKEFSATATNHDLKNAFEEMQDGMDISLCVIDQSKMTIEYAGAYNPIYLVRNGQLHKLTVDKIPINLFTNNIVGREFSNHEMQIEKNDTLYLFSDGYADQFGGPCGKKFLYKNFQDLILSVQHLPMSAQKEVFDKTIEEWKCAHSETQTDDILVLGFKIE